MDRLVARPPEQFIDIRVTEDRESSRVEEADSVVGVDDVQAVSDRRDSLEERLRVLWQLL